MVPFRHAAGIAVLAATFLSGSPDPSAAAAASPAIRIAPPPQDPAGHLVLVVEGDVSLLRVTAAAAKPDAWGGVPKGLTSDFAVVGLDAADSELVRVPLDLSAFDTDPARIGGPTVVHGCLVRSPRIGVLVNVPADERVQRWIIRRLDAQIGEATADEVGALLRGGR